MRAAAACLAAGLLLAASVPPVGVWPLALPAVVLLDRLVDGQRVATRLRRGTLTGVAWLAPSIAWMAALTPPGYLIAVALYSSYLGVACALTPPDRRRWVVLPAAVVLTEALRWSWPFGGVPLSTLAMGQVAGPLAPTVRVGGALLLVGLTVALGVAASAALARAAWASAAALAVAAAALGLAAVAPRGQAAGTLDVAVVQGGGPQGTRAVDTDEREVFERHLAASEQVRLPVDLVVWPENVVNVEGPVGETQEGRELADLSRRLGAPLVAGVVEGEEDRFRNAAVVWSAEGEMAGRYEKVRRVPFGEWIPFRSLLERVTDLSVVPRDALVGRSPAVLDTDAGRVGVVISWEVFFGGRGRDGVGAGGQVLLNPTNGSSYEGTILQTQQVASSRLRAIETGRWVVQAAPTGFSALVRHDGEVVVRTGVSERRVVHGQVERRTGSTWYVRWGDRPVVALAALVVATAWALPMLSRRRSHLEQHGDGAVVLERDPHVGAEPAGRHPHAAAP